MSDWKGAFVAPFYTLKLTLAWLLVGFPLPWGFWMTVNSATALFQQRSARRHQAASPFFCAAR